MDNKTVRELVEGDTFLIRDIGNPRSFQLWLVLGTDETRHTVYVYNTKSKFSYQWDYYMYPDSFMVLRRDVAELVSRLA